MDNIIKKDENLGENKYRETWPLCYKSNLWGSVIVKNFVFIREEIQSEKEQSNNANVKHAQLASQG